MTQQVHRNPCAAKASAVLMEQLKKNLEAEGKTLVGKVKVNACAWGRGSTRKDLSAS